jgi:hypothetical protein
VTRVSHRVEAIDNAESIARAMEVVRGQSPGHFDVIEIRAEPFPPGHTSRTWRRISRHPDRTVVDEPWPWMD